MDGKAVRVCRVWSQCQRHAVVHHIAGVGGENLKGKPPRGVDRIDTRRTALHIVALARRRGQARLIERDLDAPELLRVHVGVVRPVGHGVEAGTVADTGGNLRVHIVAAVEGVAARCLGQLVELVVAAERVVKGCRRAIAAAGRHG